MKKSSVFMTVGAGVFFVIWTYFVVITIAGFLSLPPFGFYF